jgi:hypothetical protein
MIDASAEWEPSIGARPANTVIRETTMILIVIKLPHRLSSFTSMTGNVAWFPPA